MPVLGFIESVVILALRAQVESAVMVTMEVRAVNGRRAIVCKDHGGDAHTSRVRNVHR